MLLLAGDADGNLGDQAIRMATLDLLRSHAPDIEISLLTGMPERWREEAIRPVAATPLSLVTLIREIRRADLVLIGGGGLFQDDDSLVKMPYWAAVVALCRMMGRPVIGLSIGIGPLEATSSRFAARLAFRWMERVSARDPLAVELARRLSPKPVELVPDPALHLSPAPAAAARTVLREAGVPLDGRPLIGVAPRRWFPPRRRILPHFLRHRLGLPDPHRSPEGERLVNRLAGLIEEIARSSGAFVLFLPSYAAGHEGDGRVGREVMERLSCPSTLVELSDARLYAAVCGQLDFLVAGRMHPAILASTAGTPVFALGYNAKFAGFLELVGRRSSLMEVTEFVADVPLETVVERALSAWRAGPLDPARIAGLRGRTRSFVAKALGEGRAVCS